MLEGVPLEDPVGPVDIHYSPCGGHQMSKPGTVCRLFVQEDKPFAELPGPDVRSRVPSGSCWGCVIVV